MSRNLFFVSATSNVFFKCRPVTEAFDYLVTLIIIAAECLTTQ